MKARKIIFICFALTLLIAVQSIFIGKGAVFGSSVDQLEEEIGLLKEENQELEKQIVVLSSFSAVNEKIGSIDAILTKEKEKTVGLVVKDPKIAMNQ